MEPAQPIEGKNYSAFFDFERLICHINYRGSLDAAATVAVYQWMEASIRQAGEDARRIQGCIFDFRQVTGFDTATFATASSKSISMRMQMSEVIGGIPIALLTASIEQQIMVEASMMLAKQGRNPRVRLLKTPEEAFAFFQEFHKKRTEETALIEAGEDKSV